jgi:hypothetical protein
MGGNTMNEDDKIIVNGHIYDCSSFVYSAEFYGTKREAINKIKNLLDELATMNNHSINAIDSNTLCRIQISINIFQTIIANKIYLNTNGQFKRAFRYRLNNLRNLNHVSKNNYTLWNEQFFNAD